MSYTNKDGYAPESFNDINERGMLEVNEQFRTQYTMNSYNGSNFYKFFYGGIQEIMKVQNDVAAIYTRLVDYPRYVNERIIRPTCTLDGFQDGTIRDLGIITSLKPLENGEWGQAFICADVDQNAGDFDEIKQKLWQYMADNLTLGLVYNGDHRGTIAAANGQQFEYAFGIPYETALDIRITIDRTENKTVFTPTVLVIQEMFMNGFNDNYRLGFDFEPHRYLNLSELPFAGSCKIEWSKDGTNWKTGVYDAAYNEKIIPEHFQINIV